MNVDIITVLTLWWCCVTRRKVSAPNKTLLLSSCYGLISCFVLGTHIYSKITIYAWQLACYTDYSLWLFSLYRCVKSISLLYLTLYENFMCHFTCENTWSWNIFTYEIANSHVKSTSSKFRMWNVGARNTYFTYEIFLLRERVDWS